MMNRNSTLNKAPEMRTGNKSFESGFIKAIDAFVMVFFMIVPIIAPFLFNVGS